MFVDLMFATFTAATAGSIDSNSSDGFLGYTIGDTREAVRAKCNGNCPSTVDFAGLSVTPRLLHCDGEHIGRIGFSLSIERPESAYARVHDSRTTVLEVGDVGVSTRELIASIREAHHAEGWTTTETPFALLFARGPLKRSLLIIETYPNNAHLLMQTGYLPECDFRMAI